jgi:hypothetical protein
MKLKDEGGLLAPDVHVRDGMKRGRYKFRAILIRTWSALT